jgi:hypothetical protein
VRPLPAFCCFAFCSIALAGCSGTNKINATGRVVKGGEPFTMPHDEYLRITFHPVVGPGERELNQYVARFDRETGNFTVVGGDGRGLPPGKYQVSLTHEKKKKDLFRGAFDGDKSPFVIEVTDGKSEIVLDLSDSSKG